MANHITPQSLAGPVVRIIPCLDVKDGRVVKGVNFLGLRDAGDPVELAMAYDQAGADELVFLDITASHERRSIILDVVARTAQSVFLPLTVGGGINSCDDFNRLLRSGADKVSVNSAALARPALLQEAASQFGSQCVTLAIDARANPAMASGYEVFSHGGRTATGLDAVAWALEGASLGAGEILLTSMDKDGVKDGYELRLTRLISEAVTIPVIASGGAGEAAHMLAAVQEGRASAVLAASIFHYGQVSIAEVKALLGKAGVRVRPHQTIPTIEASQLQANLRQRWQEADRQSSWTAKLLSAGPSLIASKFIEEAGELAQEALRGDGESNRHLIIKESADMIYHWLVMLTHQGINVEEIWQELARRQSESGIAEKAKRQQVSVSNKVSPPAVIAIDGNAASGKGTLAKRLARAYGFAHLDTGRLYRGVAWQVQQAGGAGLDEQQAEQMARQLSWETLARPELTDEAVGGIASKIARYAGVRQALLQRQLDFISQPPPLAGLEAKGAVLDGRDIGTVICPSAPMKFFITARAEVRAERRHKEMLDKGLPSDYSRVLTDILARDEQDQNRAVAPLVAAPDAVLIDSSDLSPQQIFALAVAIIGKRFG